jgi:hypothetical protein
MDPNPYDPDAAADVPDDAAELNTIRCAKSVVGDLCVVWGIVTVVVLLFLPTLHELPSASIWFVAFRLTIFVAATTMAIFVTIKRIGAVACLIAKWQCRRRSGRT